MTIGLIYTFPRVESRDSARGRGLQSLSKAPLVVLVEDAFMDNVGPVVSGFADGLSSVMDFFKRGPVRVPLVKVTVQP